MDKAIDKAIAKIVAVVKKLRLEEGRRKRRMESRMKRSVQCPEEG